MYIILAILAFGIIIAIHELGHFLACRALDVKVDELAIGMGPKLLSKQGKETLYSLRMIPFGGFCSMEGEYGERLERDDDDDEGKPVEAVLAFAGIVPEPAADDIADPDDDDNDTAADPTAHSNAAADAENPEPDPRSFIAQKGWKRIVILCAGSVFNIVAAFLTILFLSIGSSGYTSTTLSVVADDLPEMGPSEIMAGDKIIAINGERLYYYDDYAMFMNLNAGKPITMTILRDGERVEYQRQIYTVDGRQVYRYRISFEEIPPTFWETVKYTSYQTFNFIRLIRVSVAMMFAGEASVTEVAGPVGIVSAMNTVGQEAPNVSAGIANIVYFAAFIGVNVAAINLLPIPAMDGGRILFIFITWSIEKITRKQLNPKYENYINTGAFFLLIGLMVVIMYNDIMRLIS